MKYIKEFTTQVECDDFMKEHLYKPHVYYIQENNKIEYSRFDRAIPVAIMAENFDPPKPVQLLYYSVNTGDRSQIIIEG